MATQSFKSFEFPFVQEVASKLNLPIPAEYSEAEARGLVEDAFNVLPADKQAAIMAAINQESVGSSDVSKSPAVVAPTAPNLETVTVVQQNHDAGLERVVITSQTWNPRSSHYAN